MSFPPWCCPYGCSTRLGAAGLGKAGLGKAGLATAGIAVRAGGRPVNAKALPPLTAALLRELYERQQLTMRQVADRVGGSGFRIVRALDRCRRHTHRRCRRRRRQHSCGGSTPSRAYRLR